MDATPPYVIPLNAVKPKQLTLVPSDPGSRYKTKQLQVQTIGKSKMIKSVFSNIIEVAKSMQVPPSYIVHFIGYEIGAQAKFDAKKPERQQASLTGEHDTKDLSKMTVKFINEVLLCVNCGLPELLINIEKGVPVGSCRACGSNKPLPITNEKFKKYVTVHPPSSSSAFGGNKAGSKKESAVRKDRGKKKEKEEKEEKDDEEDDEEEEEEEEEEIAVKETKGKKGGEKEEEEEEWFTDTSAEASRKRREQFLVETDLTADKGEVDPVESMKQLIQSESIDKLADKLKELKTSEDLGEEIFTSSLFSAFFVEGSDVLKVAKEKKAVLEKLLTSAPRQKTFLSSLDSFLGSNKSAPVIVKGLYDLDLLEEDNIISWFNASKSTGIKDSLAPLIKWFEEAEEESEEEDDE